MEIEQIISNPELKKYEYFRTDKGVLYKGDCHKVMQHLQEKSIDLILFSPPYNMGGGKSLGSQPNSSVGNRFYGEYQDNKNDHEYREWLQDIIEYSLKISRYVFCNIQFLRSTRGIISDIHNLYADNLKDIFIWNKQCVSNITAKHGGMGKGYEIVFMMGQDNKSIFKHNNFPENGYVPNIKTWYKKEFFKEHHATFPVEMPMYFIENFTKKDDVVLDIFNGTGTTCYSAEKLGRRWIGIETEEQYCDIAKKRIQSEYNQLKMF